MESNSKFWKHFGAKLYLSMYGVIQKCCITFVECACKAGYGGIVELWRGSGGGPTPP